MKKLITMMLFAVLAIGAAMAQNSKTITGYVVDKNGNPLAGAEVMAAGGGATAITDSDGSFTLDVHVLLKKVTASYPGMGDKTVSIDKSSNLVITLKPKTIRYGFISFIGAGGYASERDGYYDDSYPYGSYGAGFMGGQIGNWGWYVKGMYNALGYDGKGGMLTAGATKRLGQSSTHLYFGLGVASHDFEYDYWGGAFDLGAIFKIGQHLNIITGLNYSRSLSSEEYYDGYYNSYDSFNSYVNNINFNVGIGYVF